MKHVCLFIALALVGVAPRTVRAEVERYALLIGSNAGDADEVRLRYAEDDAHRMYDVLHELGGFRAENLVLLRDQSASAARRALIALNDRIRTETTLTGAQTELIVYYSGHSDQSALHLGRTNLELVELEQLVRGSSAALRVLILDSCRSGALTRVKGGTMQPGFDVALDQPIPSDGVIFWTATSESENAQESDVLRGSFFTHYLVSGLLGAADRDGSGSVTLGEAYQYTYDNTLRATSRTLSGTQHPTFHYELAGHGDVVLTTLNRTDGQRAMLGFPAGSSYLLLQDSEDGAVVAEVGAHDRTRRLSVRPGRYFVRGRNPDYLLEGALVVQAGEQHEVREQDLARFEYARLVRKGHADLDYTQGAQAGYTVRSSLWSGGTVCQGPFAGYALDLAWLSLAPRVALCRGGLREAPGLDLDEIDFELRGAHAWDLGRLAISAGANLGGSHLRHDWGIAGEPNTENLAHVGLSAGATIDLVDGFYSGIEIDGLAYFRPQVPQQATAAVVVAQPTAKANFVVVSTPYALRVDILLLGKRW